MARILALGAAVVLLFAGIAAGVSANDGCKDAVTGYSGTFGKRAAAGAERFNNQTAQWRAKGAITKLNAYYSFTHKCIQGVKVTYGYNAQDAKLLGQESGLAAQDLKLEAGEHFVKAQIKAGPCVEFLRLVTSKGRVFEAGNAASPTQLITSYPNKPTGFLAAVRGYEAYKKTADGSTTRSSLQTLQFVWANCNPLAGGSAPRPAAPKKATPPPAAEDASEPVPVLETPTEGGAEEKIALPACPSMLDMCSHDASSTSTAFCPALSPFKKSTCLGGCCVSSGKCTSSSCAISGVGKEVPNTICYGLNPAIAIGASPNCRGLACKLAIPGCTSDLLGGSCLGTVVDLSGKAAEANPAGAALVGYPCLDVTPSDKTLDGDGKLSLSGPFVAKLWSICDCQAPMTVGSTNIPIPRLGKLNMTDIKSLIEVLRPGLDTSHPLQSVMDAVKSKIPPLIVPDGHSAVNLTNALSLLGSLVGKSASALEASQAAGADGVEGAGSLAAVANLLKGASAVANAANSTNPLGSLLGALATKGPNGEKNPLAGLGNLVTALAGRGADTTERADVLNNLLTGLSGSTAAAPGADLLGAVSKLLSGADGESPAVDVPGLLAKFKTANSTELMKMVSSAVQQGKAAVEDGTIDLPGILAKAQQFVSKDGGVDGEGNPTVSAILKGVQALASKADASEADGEPNPLSFLSGLRNGTGGLTLQKIVDAAHKAGPLLQQLSGGEGGEAGPLAGILKAFAGGEGGNGLDMNSVVALAQKAGPLLQALGGGQGAGGDTLGKILGAAGLNGEDGSKLDLKSVKGLLEAAAKAGPVLQSLTKASGADGNAPLKGLQAFLDKLPHMDKKGAAGAEEEAT